MNSREKFPHTAFLYFAHDEGMSDIPCDVIITNDGTISVQFDDDLGLVYKGKQKGEGHFLLTVPSTKNKLTLHRFPKSKILEGYLLEDDVEFMLRIRLAQ